MARVAVCFMVGSFLFALGSFPPYGQLVDPRVVGVTFFLGSIFFTAAAAGQLRETRTSAPTDRLAFWACAVQLVGTVLFNMNTLDSLFVAFDPQEVRRLVWGPDMFGSVAFLVASHLAWLDVCHGLWCVQRDNDDWWIAALNYVGSFFFMLSAIASFVLPTTGETLNTAIVNSGTFLGAVCFFAGAYLLLPVTVRRATAGANPAPPTAR